MAVPQGGELHVSVTARPPEVVAAFYEARRFPPEAIALLQRRCFVTVGLHNRSRAIIWLEPARWRFLAALAGISRLDADHWRVAWERLGLEAAARARDLPLDTVVRDA